MEGIGGEARIWSVVWAQYSAFSLRWDVRRAERVEWEFEVLREWMYFDIVSGFI